MNKAYVEQIRNGLSTTALSMDTQWAMMHNHKLNDWQRLSSEACYQGLMQTLCFMGGDWVRDQHGKHRVFLAGMSSRENDEYTCEE